MNNYDSTTPIRVHHPLGAALLQLLGWIGFLGIGYFARGRIGTGLAMLIGWWVVFWALLFLTVASFGLLWFVMHAVWLIVPPLSAFLLYVDPPRP
ncbi:MAG: hypothetical protein ACRDFS_07690 [Chloroflexota bacterium]